MSVWLATVHVNGLDSRFRGNDRYRHPREGGGPVPIDESFVSNDGIGYFHGSEASRHFESSKYWDSSSPSAIVRMTFGGLSLSLIT